jgi:hypothetical protein
MYNTEFFYSPSKNKSDGNCSVQAKKEMPQEESHEIFGVPFSYTVIHPPTMMIKPSHTAVADAAMLGSSRPE